MSITKKQREQLGLCVDCGTTNNTGFSICDECQRSKVLRSRKFTELLKESGLSHLIWKKYYE